MPLPLDSSTTALPRGPACRLTPQGRVVVRAGGPPALDRIASAFAQGNGPGLLHLGAVEVDTDLPADLAWWRRLGVAYVQAVCAAIDPLDPAAAVHPGADPAVLRSLVDTLPPMTGAELVTVDLLAGMWDELGVALAQVAAAHASGVRGFLHDAHPAWHVAGRVCLHLAENRRDPDHPFAFIATYARQRPGRSAPQHLPLARALKEYAGARNRAQLLALLQPLQRAAEHSATIAGLLDSGDIYHPLAWTPAQAHALLRDADALERAGLVLRLPDWWRRRQSRRPAVSVTVGDEQPSVLGVDAMLDFQVAVTLGGERLTQAEVDALLSETAGLVLIKGQWVEVDPDRLAAVLDHFEEVQARTADGVDFLQAMRLLSGAAIDGDDADLDDDLAAWSEVVAGQWLSARLDALRSVQVDRAIDGGAGLQARLRPYQKVGVQWMWSLFNLGVGGCLADDMGLGKTIQVIGLLSLLHQREDAPCEGRPRQDAVDLLVVPASLVDNWRAELARFAPHLRVLVAHPSAMPSRKLRALSEDDVRRHQVVITTYGTVLRTDWMRALSWRTVTLDEAQAIKNPGAKQTRAVKKLSARWKLALTGTPVENRLGDLWSIFDFLNPGMLGSAKAFGRFCKTMADHPGDGYAPLRRLVAPWILRRLKTDRSIIADLPDKTEVTARCLLTKLQAALYAQAVDELARTLEHATGIERRGVVLAWLTRFKQICNHPSQWLGDGEFRPEQSGKFQRLADLCEPIGQRQDKLLVFTQYRSMTDPLQRFLTDCMGGQGLVLHGGTPVKKRAALVRRFQEDPDVPFMVLSIKAGGTGLNLTAANHVIHFDRWWNPAVEDQATDRAYRIGQHRNVVVHKFVCQGTVEERIDQLITSKKALSDQVLAGGAEVQLTELSDAELLDLVSLDIDKAVTA
ncbi:MAG: DEAD/DEAH box helicase [Deltaproteobacteria bacterium]|nr:MAG: DEAD/DEAH box helicase [Deltaproteobacteria bacterium]